MQIQNERINDQYVLKEVGLNFLVTLAGVFLLRVSHLFIVGFQSRFHSYTSTK